MSHIRTATIEDVGAIAHVHVESWRTTYAGIVPDAYLAGLDEAERELLWRDWLTQNIPVLVFAVENETVGFASGGPIREPLSEFDAELYAIYLLQAAQKRGIGTALLRELAKLLRGTGYKSMLAWVLAGNRSSRFYESSGAVPVGSKQTEIAGVNFSVVAYGWTSLEAIAGGA